VRKLQVTSYLKCIRLVTVRSSLPMLIGRPMPIIWRLRALAFVTLALAVFGAFECIALIACRVNSNTLFTKGRCVLRCTGGHSIQKPQAPTPQAPVRNRQTRKVSNAKVRIG